MNAVTFDRDDFERFVRAVHRDLEVALVHFEDLNVGSGKSWVSAAIRKLPPLVEPYGYIEYRDWPPKEEARDD